MNVNLCVCVCHFIIVIWFVRIPNGMRDLLFRSFFTVSTVSTELLSLTGYFPFHNLLISCKIYYFFHLRILLQNTTLTVNNRNHSGG